MGTQAGVLTSSTRAVLKGNMLTTDPRDVRNDAHSDNAHPELCWRTHAFIWLREALTETKHLSLRAGPLACLARQNVFSVEERIVPRIRIPCADET